MVAVSALQFGRGIAVEVVPPLGPVIRVNPTRTLTDPSPFTQLRVTFQYEKSIEPSPNRCRVVMHNLAKTTRQRITGVTKRISDFSSEFAFTEFDGLVLGTDLGGQVETIHRNSSIPYVRVLAGYRGVTAIMFEGTGMRAESIKRGPDWMTIIEAKDGGLAEQAISGKAFAKGFPTVLVIDYLVAQLGWSTGQPLTQLNPLLPPQLLSGTLRRSWVVYGKARESLTALLAGLDVDWFVDDGEFWILPPGGTLPGVVTTFDRTGAPGSAFILDTPRRVESDAVEVRSLLSTSVRVGGLANVVSAEFTGSYRCERIRGQGDNRGGTMTTTALLRDLSSIDITA